MKNRPSFRHLLFFLSAFFLFACSGEAPQTPTWKNQDNTLRIRSASKFQTFNPFLYRTTYEAVVFERIFQYLLAFDPENLQLAPQLAKARPRITPITEGPDAGGTRYDFEIFEEAVWDDGTPVTGHDYAFSMKIFFNPRLPMQRFLPYYSFVKDVQVDPDNPKKFTVIADKPYFLAEAVLCNTVVLPAHVYDPDNLLKDIALSNLVDPNKAQLIAENDPRLQQFADAFLSDRFMRQVIQGSGPYRLEEWTEGQQVILKKKENWWGDALAERYPLLRASVETLIFKPIEDQIATVAALRSEDVDLASQLDSKAFMELKADSSFLQTFQLFNPPYNAFFYIALNNQNPKLSDRRVRKALAHLLPVDEIIEKAYSGLGTRLVGPFLPDKPYYHKGLQPVPYDPEKARQLLSEAGWEDSDNDGIRDKEIEGQRVKLSLEFLFAPNIPFQENYTEIFKNSARQAGVEIVKVPVEATVMGDRLRTRNYELTGRGASSSPVPDDPKQLFHTDSDVPGGSNYFRYSNPRADSIMDAIQVTTDENQRNQLYRELQEILYEDQPLILLFSPQNKVAVHRRFDARPTSLNPGIDLYRIRLKTTRELAEEM